MDILSIVNAQEIKNSQDRIHFEESQPTLDTKFEFKLSSVKTSFIDYLKLPYFTKAGFRDFQAETQDFKLRFSLLNYPLMENRTTFLEVQNYDIPPYLSLFEVDFKKLQLNEEAYKRKEERLRRAYFFERAFGLREDSYEQSARDLYITYIHLFDTSCVYPLNSSSFSYKVQSSLGFEDALGYASLLNLFPELQSYYALNPCENLMQIKEHLYKEFLGALVGNCVFPDEDSQERVKSFANTFSEYQLCRRSNFFFDENYSYYDVWESLERKNLFF